MYVAINIEDWNLYFMSGLIALNPKTFPIYLFIYFTWAFTSCD
jgi:hypothetical protein